MTLELYLWTGYIFIMGLFMGSFFNVVGIRVPEKISLLGRSKCPDCGHQLGVLELIPIIGYIFLRGRCKNCKSHISVKYPIMEFITGFLFAISFVFLHENMIEYILVIVFISLLVIVSVSDLYYQVVPDVVLLVFLPLLLGLRIASPVIVWYEGIIGAVIGFGFMFLMSIYGKIRFQKEALGGGDIKLYGLIGLVLGFNTIFISVLLAGVYGLLYFAILRPKNHYIPFVPFIALGSITAYFVGPYVNEWILNILV
ncbi:prepilin peptidase [Candidatus Xianfuyuplasma coldseepsis]|uniref:Prepilin peptidase n=1 Tax=Candidatus Xianfuyuplasma coldseepsis TaxID=2782163 RepID=A0A7L7KUK8_9MOLU|nr:A24 family peptidase [Xianfuyuplasma coldseepsis]QMS85926.1 prepilin peptidase [Xianfuyuplasma coldseepsis]